MNEYSPEVEEEVTYESEDEVREPSMFRVLLHNDDYTTMEFVVEILIIVFNKSPEEAVEIMLNAAGLAFIVGSSRWAEADGQLMFIFILSQQTFGR